MLPTQTFYVDENLPNGTKIGDPIIGPTSAIFTCTDISNITEEMLTVIMSGANGEYIMELQLDLLESLEWSLLLGHLLQNVTTQWHGLMILRRVLYFVRLITQQ